MLFKRGGFPFYVLRAKFWKNTSVFDKRRTNFDRKNISYLSVYQSKPSERKSTDNVIFFILLFVTPSLTLFLVVAVSQILFTSRSSSLSSIINRHPPPPHHQKSFTPTVHHCFFYREETVAVSSIIIIVYLLLINTVLVYTSSLLFTRYYYSSVSIRQTQQLEAVVPKQSIQIINPNNTVIDNWSAVTVYYIHTVLYSRGSLRLSVVN